VSNQTGLKARFIKGNEQLDIKLDLLLFEEDGVNFVYSPALDLTGYGHGEENAKKSFEIVLEEFVRYTDRKKTIYSELERLGWTVNRLKKRVTAPVEDTLVERNSTYRELKDNPNVHASTSRLQLALT